MTDKISTRNWSDGQSSNVAKHCSDVSCVQVLPGPPQVTTTVEGQSEDNLVMLDSGGLEIGFGTH